MPNIAVGLGKIVSKKVGQNWMKNWMCVDF